MTIWYGGDYNPEQWPERIWDDDVRLMQKCGVNLVTVGVFSWASLEPAEGEFHFEWLDKVLDKLYEGGISVNLATATASPPPWLTHNHPEVLPVTADGVRLAPGSRQHYCPSSPVYRRLAARLVTAIAERYGRHPALRLWHVNNEYGCHVRHCYCDVSAQAFRGWLERKYRTIHELNAAWAGTFWSQVYGGFEEIYPPRTAPTFKNPTQLLDFDRFSSDELLDCYRREREILRAMSPDVPITTNFLGVSKNVDYWSWSPEVDLVSYDSYPDPGDEEAPAKSAMGHDLMRSLRGGQPWLLMEQSPGAVSWFPHNLPKPPGQQRAWSYQAIARGADGVLFFQWRQSVAGAERFVTGLLPHVGTDSRVWREGQDLGAELATMGRVVGSRLDSRVGIAFDWDSWWSIEQPALPATLSYWDGLFAWYRELYARNVVADFVAPSGDLSGYGVVIVPSLFVTSSATAANLDAFVEHGGQLLVTYQTGIADKNAHLMPDGYLGGLRATLGIWIEEFAPLPPAATATIGGELLGDVVGHLWSEYVHAVDAEVLARFKGEPLDGWPALTRRRAGAGMAWYLATMPEPSARGTLIEHLLDEAGIAAGPPPLPTGVEAVRRGELLFVINHSGADVRLSLPGTDLLTGREGGELTLARHGVAILDQRAAGS